MTSTLHCSYLQVYDAGFYAAKIFMTWNRGITVKLLYIHLGTLVLENRVKQLKHWAVMKH